MVATFIAIAAMLASGPAIEIRELAEGAAPPHAGIEELSWLEGRWIGEGLGGCSEETISAPVGGQIMGMFRQAGADGAPMFYEFYLFGAKGDSISLRLKHFNPDMTGWEEKDGYVEFPLVAIEKDAVYFDGLTYARDGAKGLRAGVRIGNNGRGDFTLRKAKKGERCPSAARP